MSNKKQNRSASSESNALLWLCIISSSIFLGLYALIDVSAVNHPTWLGILIFAINVILSIIAYAVYKKKKNVEEDFKAQTLIMEKAMTSLMRIPISVPLPTPWAKGGTTGSCRNWC